MKRNDGMRDWETIEARLRALPTVSEPNTLGAYAEALALLDDYLADSLEKAEMSPERVHELTCLAGDLRAAAEKLRRGEAPDDSKGGLSAPIGLGESVGVSSGGDGARREAVGTRRNGKRKEGR